MTLTLYFSTPKLSICGEVFKNKTKYFGLRRFLQVCFENNEVNEILVSARGPSVLVLRLRVWGQGLTINVFNMLHCCNISF